MSLLTLISSTRCSSIRLVPTRAWKACISSKTFQHLPSQSYKTLSRISIICAPTKPVYDGFILGCRNCRLFRLSQGSRAGEAVNGKKIDPVKLGTKRPVPKKSDMARLLRLAKPEKWRLSGAIAFLLISSTVSMAIPFCMGKVIDIIYTSAKGGQLKEKLSNICKILLGVFLIGGVANFGRVYLISVSGQRIVKTLREKLFSSIVKQDIAFFDKNKTGELINRLSADTTLVGASITQNISDGLRSTAQAIGGIGMMFFVSPKLTLVALGIVPPIAVVSIIYGRFLKKITKNLQDSLANATQVAEERLSNIRTVRAFSQDNNELGAYQKKILNVLQISMKESFAKAVFWASTGLSGNIVVLSVFYYGGLMMQDSMITVGELSAFLLYAAYIGISMGGLTSFYTELMKGLGASSRLWQLVDRKPAIPISGGLIPSDPLLGNVEFRDVHFKYPTREDNPIFDGLNLSIPAGQITAVVGPSGSGKSTLAALLLRFYDPNKGDICFDGQPLQTLDPSWVRSHTGTVSQEPVLFSSSVAENIAYGASDVSKVTHEQIVEAAKKANAYNFVSGFEKGFDTLVGERGLMLSGGQRQRIAIARAIIGNPKILLLDEATSALDAESEFLVQEALERLMVGRTVLTIAHRLSTIKNANQIAVMDKGKIVEAGSYNSLMDIENGLFRKLVERQTIFGNGNS
ncbi:ATP-binding cassette sub-family B member 10, mitochondrial-like [Lineus longissimus]|uniref:ATP-binding cassette sub-family B member 10, mitochondrial-like n=1 Tax=Lineus longissimus TaxID=88925 RepID=UPI002B4CDAF7